MASKNKNTIPKLSVNSGFTATEIMISVVIMALIFIPMIDYFSRGQRNFQKGAQMQESLLGAAILMKQLKIDLKSATAYGSKEGKGGFKVNVEPDGTVTTLSFPVYSGVRGKSSLSNSNSKPLLSLVQYEFKPDFSSKNMQKKGSVVRRIIPHDLDTRTKATDRVIAKNIAGFKVFEYSIAEQKYYRISIIGYSESEILGGEAAIQLFTSVAPRYANSWNFDKNWLRVENNRGDFKE